MATPKDIIKKLDEATKIALTFDSHLNQLINEVGRLLPTHNAMVVLLDKVGFDKEQQIEDNLKLLIDHHTSVVAENTILRKTITDRDALMEQLRRVVLGDVE
jgi:predicted AAA+ superfamily ATPase